MLKQFSLLFCGTFFISLFVLMMQFLWRYVDDLIGKGLSIDVLAEFFWYMSLMLVPQALPLAVLLSSLITMGNIGENSELTAIKAAGISLMQTLRGMAFASLLIAGASFYFQNYIGPVANNNLYQLLLAMKQKSPELEIPEGIFYDGIPNSNIYVQKKNLETGKLYGIMIYRMNGSFEDAAIILADSGMMQSTADKQHLLLTLHSGEWFENMRSQELSQNANVPYRRETFINKKIILDFDSGFNIAESSGIANDAKSKSLQSIMAGLDSLNLRLDTLGTVISTDMNRAYFSGANISKADTAKAIAHAKLKTNDIDTLYSKLKHDEKRIALQHALSKVEIMKNDLEFRKVIVEDVNTEIRKHKIEAINKFVLSIICVVFFFIGAPLGAIIRKGGLGVPIIIAVIVFIIFYILDNTGYRMARLGEWPIWFGKGLALAVLIPLSAFVTYKANKDSVVMSMDPYRNFFMRLLGLRFKRHIDYKEVIITDPDYAADAQKLAAITDSIRVYSKEHHLTHLPNIIKVFFVYQPDNEIERISQMLEPVIEDLSNTRDRYIMDYINKYPVMSLKAHTRPFEKKWMNITSFVILPLGAFLYIRMWRFRLRLARDLRTTNNLNALVIKRINELK